MDLRLPITYPILLSLVQSLESLLHGYSKTLYQALFMFAFFTYARIGELTVTSKHLPSVLLIEDVAFITSNTSIREVKVTFRRFKHNLTGLPHYISFKAVKGLLCPVSKLMEYLQLRGNKPGPLFCNSNLSPILRRQFDCQLHSALSFCGLSSKCYKGHSFRIGKATFDAENNVPDSVIRARGRWKSEAFKKYIRVSTN